VKHPGQSGVFLLGDGLDTFVARALLARQAKPSIDLQYYMFRQDTVGNQAAIVIPKRFRFRFRCRI
jgi:phosphatidylserine/phosphatidylglycerophosphate/cardiolipin synthase-like enzyme